MNKYEYYELIKYRNFKGSSKLEGIDIQYNYEGASLKSILEKYDNNINNAKNGETKIMDIENNKTFGDELREICGSTNLPLKLVEDIKKCLLEEAKNGGDWTYYFIDTYINRDELMFLITHFGAMGVMIDLGHSYDMESLFEYDCATNFELHISW